MVIGQTIAETEVLVIGAGPGGYVAAIRAAQLGYQVMLIDKAGELGGLCLHHGCIPSKALIHALKVYHEAKTSQAMGITVSASLDFTKTQEWKKTVINRLAGGIAGLCKQHKIQVVKAAVHFQNLSTVGLEGEGLDFNAVEFRSCIIATGSKPRSLPTVPFSANILSSREVLELKTPPKTFCVIGGGYIGVELGVMLAKAGSQVTILEGTQQILGAVEPELATVALKRLGELGISVKLGENVKSALSTAEGAEIVTDTGTIRVEKALLAVGHGPVTDGLQLELANVKMNEKGFIITDNQCRTSNKHIFAVGDVTGGIMLAHKASAQGRVAAEALAGKPTVFEPQAIPTVVFSDPEIATVGLRSQDAIKQYGEIKVGTFPFAALGKALAINETDGFVKIVATKDNILLGVHAVGPGVTDYISEAALAIEMGASAEDLALTIHPHPTLGESLAEAAEALLGQSIHLYQPKK